MTRSDLGARARLDSAFAREERGADGGGRRAVAGSGDYPRVARGLQPKRGLALAWVLSTAAFFLVTGVAQLRL